MPAALLHTQRCCLFASEMPRIGLSGCIAPHRAPLYSLRIPATASPLPRCPPHRRFRVAADSSRTATVGREPPQPQAPPPPAAGPAADARAAAIAAAPLTAASGQKPTPSAPQQCEQSSRSPKRRLSLPRGRPLTLTPVLLPSPPPPAPPPPGSSQVLPHSRSCTESCRSPRRLRPPARAAADASATAIAAASRTAATRLQPTPSDGRAPRQGSRGPRRRLRPLARPVAIAHCTATTSAPRTAGLEASANRKRLKTTM
jgi:hypothetical protein